MKKIFFVLATLLVVGSVSAQLRKDVPVIVPKQVIFPIDADFSKQSFWPRQPVKHSLNYEVYITTDGKLHCRTGVPIKEAEISFTQPDVSYKGANGTSTGSGSTISRKLILIKAADAEEYVTSIKADNYKKMHKITLKLTAVNSDRAEVKLINNKVPEKIEN